MRAIIALVALGVADIMLLLMVALPDAARLSGHLAVSIAGYWVSWKIRPIGLRVAVAGLLGPLGLLVAQGLAWRRRLRLPAPIDREGSAGLTLPASAARMLDGRMQTPAAESIGALSTVLAHGDVAARRRALEAVVRSFRPALSPLIVQALADPDQTIRALAAAAAARVIGTVSAQRATLAHRVAYGDPEARDTLAALLAEQAGGNALLSDSQRRAMRQEALSLIAVLPETAPRRLRIEALLAEAAWDAGDYAAIDAMAAQPVSHRSTIAWWGRPGAA